MTNRNPIVNASLAGLRNPKHCASYLAGLIEGDGHINARQLIILFNGAHGQGAQSLRSLLGGTVAPGKVSYSWRYVLTHRASLDRVLRLTSCAWVGPYKAQQIRTHGHDKRLNLNLTTDAPVTAGFWFAGFSDADGCFDISIRRCRTSRSGLRVELRLTFSQRHPTLLVKIRDAFGVRNVHWDPGKPAGRVQITGQERLRTTVVPYFDAHPPLLKADQYDIWRRAFAIVLERRHLTNDGLAKLKALRLQLTTLKKPPGSRCTGPLAVRTVAPATGCVPPSPAGRNGVRFSPGAREKPAVGPGADVRKLRRAVRHSVPVGLDRGRGG